MTRLVSEEERHEIAVQIAMSTPAPTPEQRATLRALLSPYAQPVPVRRTRRPRNTVRDTRIGMPGGDAA